MNNRYKDFDQGRAEKQGDPIQFKIHGMLINLPPEIPAIVPVMALRLTKKYGTEADVPQDELAELSLSIIGKKALDLLLADGITTDELGEVIRWALSVYSGEEVGDDAGNPTAPVPDAGA
ncbi:hypothetical protein LLG46_02395 [bacterium]|nr:hypothetical protein [bacterium]